MKWITSRQPALTYLFWATGLAAVLYLAGVSEVRAFAAGSFFGTTLALGQLHQMILDAKGDKP
jgi:hypothetical protein